MKKVVMVLAVVFLAMPLLFGQENPGGYEGKEVENVVSAVRKASAGDYILLPSGKKYVLTKIEIDVLNGNFNYSDLSDAETETRDDGTQVKTISEAHTAYIFPNNKSIHILKTEALFTEYMQQHIEPNYFMGRYVDSAGNFHESQPNGSARFYVFRASVQYQTISDGVDDVEMVTITAYNYKGQNFIMKYFSTNNDWVWGHGDEGIFNPVGEGRNVEFDIE